MHDALFHGEALLVVAARDAELVAFEFVADAVAGHFGAHAAVHEDAQLALVFDFDELLRAVGRVRDVELHLDGGGEGCQDESCCCCGRGDGGLGGVLRSTFVFEWISMCGC